MDNESKSGEFGIPLLITFDSNASIVDNLATFGPNAITRPKKELF